MGASVNLRINKSLAFIITVRVLSVFLVQTSYVPDEYWQSLEVAHKQVFGYGQLTWEWTQGIRSYLYPSFFAAVYKLLQLIGLDLPELLIFLPRILQALLSSAADYAFYKWTGQHKWGLFMIIAQYFWFYTATRTLSNSTETALITLALARFPFEASKTTDNGWLCYAALSCVIRPTAAIIWIPLCAYHLLTTTEKKLRLIGLTYIPIGLSIFGLSTALDSYFNEGFVFTPWEFLSINLVQDISSFYGTQPWYWYFVVGFPAILGINLIPFLFASYEATKDKVAFKTQRLLLFVIFFVLGIYSISPHKEFRFILPLVPIVTYIIQDTLSRWSRKAKNSYVYAVFAALLLGNLVPSLYLGIIHQRGPLDTMYVLRGIAEKYPMSASFLFLMPCHSTPLQSHLHVNVPVRFLTCEPNLTQKMGYKDEADQFYENPTKWFQTEYTNQQVGETGKKTKFPSHIVIYDVLAPKIGNILSYYNLKHTIFNAHIVDGRVGNKIQIYVRAN